MENTKVLTSLLVLTLTGPTLGYPYTRGVASRSGGRGRDPLLEAGLGDYLLGYTEDQYALPEYQPSKRYTYGAPRPRINAETLAALLPFLTAASDDYTYDYNSYNDDEGTWYDNTAGDDIADTMTEQDSSLLPMLLDRRALSPPPVRYSLEDLETLEREAAMEDNTENQLHALMATKNLKRANMPVLGGRVALGPRLLRKGQKEEAFDIPATSVRRPVFARTVTNQQEDQTNTQSITKYNNNSSTQKPEEIEKVLSASSTSSNTGSSSSSNTGSSSNTDSSSSSCSNSSSSSSKGEKDVASATTMTPYMLTRYEAFKKYLDRERNIRQLEDMQKELNEEKRAPHKRFVADQESLPQQLANLKKTVA